jgi:hypothetical protein
MPHTGFESFTLAGRRPQSYALDRVATNVGYYGKWEIKNGNFLRLYYELRPRDSPVTETTSLSEISGSFVDEFNNARKRGILHWVMFVTFA